MVSPAVALVALAAIGLGLMARRKKEEQPLLTASGGASGSIAVPATGMPGVVLTGPVTSETYPADLANKISAAIQSGDPAAMRVLADELDRRGFGSAATMLRAQAGSAQPQVTRTVFVPPQLQPTSAAQVDNAAVRAVEVLQQAVAASAGTAPPPVVPLAPAAPPAVVSEDPRRLQAQALANHLATTKRYSENRELVRAFQSANGLQADGMYGAGTGLKIAEYGIVPPKPYYFSKDAAKTRAAKALWTQTMLRYAAQDPARAAQWTAVSDVRSV